MKNVEILKALPDLKSLKHENEALKAQIKRLLKQQQQLDREIDIIERVTEVFEGVPLTVREDPTVYGRSLHVHGVSHEIDRWAEVYANAHNNGADYGLRCRHTSSNSDDWRGVGWAWRDACLWARRFVAHGARVPEAIEQMAKLRHQLDPEGRAPKRRVLAFEAAYEAGAIELAKELIAGRTKRNRRSRTASKGASVEA